MAARRRWIPVRADGSLDERFEKDAGKARRRSRLKVIAKRVDGPIEKPKGSKQPRPASNRTELVRQVDALEKQIEELAGAMGIDMDCPNPIAARIYRDSVRAHGLGKPETSGRGGAIIVERANGSETIIESGRGDVRRMKIEPRKS
jgi:hypothetical protein